MATFFGPLHLCWLIAILLFPTSAAAVSCGGQVSVKQAYASAHDVFSAQVEAIYSAPYAGRDDFNFARLRVLQVWKGDLEPGDTVSTTAEGSVAFVSDGFVPLQGSSVLIYTGGSQPFIVSTCSRSASLESTRDIPSLDRLARKRARQVDGQ